MGGDEKDDEANRARYPPRGIECERTRVFEDKSCMRADGKESGKNVGKNKVVGPDDL